MLGAQSYNIKAANDVLSEIGKYSKDGKSRVKFFEMKLEKVE